MDQLRICSSFLKKMLSDILTKKAKKYVHDIQVESFQIERQQDGTYKVHANCDIYFTEDQVSQLLHSL